MQGIELFCYWLIVDIHVLQSELTSLLKTAEELRIKGLAEVSWRSDREMEAAESGDEESDQGPQPKKLKTEPYSPKPIQNSITASQQSRDEYNVRFFSLNFEACILSFSWNYFQVEL